MFERNSKQSKRLPLNQGKSFINLQKRSFFIYEPLSKIWTALEAEKEGFSNWNSEINPEEVNPLIVISYLTDQVVLLFGQVVNTCAYTGRFNILMSFMSDKNKVEMMLKKSVKAFKNNEKKMLVRKFEKAAKQLNGGSSSVV